jgi:hypothetical protein
MVAMFMGATVLSVMLILSSFIVMCLLVVVVSDLKPYPSVLADVLQEEFAIAVVAEAMMCHEVKIIRSQFIYVTHSTRLRVPVVSKRRDMPKVQPYSIALLFISRFRFRFRF